jgi:hypothetical protein
MRLFSRFGSGAAAIRGIARRALVVATLATGLATFGASAPVATSLSVFGPEGMPVPAASVAAAPPVQALSISDEYGKQQVLAANRAQVVSRMLHRAETTAAGQSPDRYSPASSIWAGYVASASATGRAAIGVAGFFTLSQVCSGCDTVAPWVGLGGYSTANLIQTGVNVLSMQPWFELLPGPPQYIQNFPVRNGDLMYGQVSWDGSTRLWYILIEDLTDGYYYHNEFAYNTDTRTAEWVVEAFSGSIPPFNPISFTQSTWLDNNGFVQSINSSEGSVTRLNLYGTQFCGTIQPGSLGSDGRSFFDYSYHC